MIGGPIPVRLPNGYPLPCVSTDRMPLDSIVVAYDCRPPSVAALGSAAEIAQHTGAKLTILCVFPTNALPYGAEMPAGPGAQVAVTAIRDRLARAKAELGKRGIAAVETVFLEGDPVTRILEYATTDRCQLIVVGTRGLSTTGRLFLGSVSDGILHRAPCSVLVVRAPPESPGPSRPT